jgi:hypothetical protein
MPPQTGLFRFAVGFYKDIAPTALEMVKSTFVPFRLLHFPHKV